MTPSASIRRKWLLSNNSNRLQLRPPQSPPSKLSSNSSRSPLNRKLHRLPKLLDNSSLAVRLRPSSKPLRTMLPILTRAHKLQHLVTSSSRCSPSSNSNSSNSRITEGRQLSQLVRMQPTRIFLCSLACNLRKRQLTQTGPHRQVSINSRCQVRVSLSISNTYSPPSRALVKPARHPLNSSRLRVLQGVLLSRMPPLSTSSSNNSR